jgi:hypothetical protein
MSREPGYDIDCALKVGIAARDFARNETMPARCSQLGICWYGIEFDTNKPRWLLRALGYINGGGGGGVGGGVYWAGTKRWVVFDR